MADLGGTLGRLPSYLRLARNLATDPGLSRRRKAVLGASLAYVVSPIDLVPGIIPVVGQLDDLAALLLGLRQALGGLSDDRAGDHLRRVGLDAVVLGDDLARVRTAAGWVARTAARKTLHVAAVSVRGAARLAGAAIRHRRRPTARPR